MRDVSAAAIEDATRDIWNVVVIGAGPAGTVAAFQLAKRGYRTLLLERKRIPRAKVCGGCLSFAAIQTLALAGLSHRLKHIACSPISAVRIRNRRYLLEVPTPTGVAIFRSELDAALSDAACSAGASLLTGVNGVVTSRDPSCANHRQIELRVDGRCAGVVRAQVVLACDGLGHPSLQALPEFQGSVGADSRFGVGAVLQAPGPDYPAGAIHMAVGNDGYVGVVRVTPDLVNVAAALDPVAVRERSVAALVQSILAEARFDLPADLRDAAFQGTPRLTRCSPRLASDRVFLLGDAAGYVEPFTGEGMAWALSSAMAVGPIVERAVQHWDASLIEHWQRVHRRQIGRQQTVCRWIAALLKRPWAVHLAGLAFSVMPSALNPIVKYVNAVPFKPASAAR